MNPENSKRNSSNALHMIDKVNDASTELDAINVWNKNQPVSLPPTLALEKLEATPIPQVEGLFAVGVPILQRSDE
jgi:hypothetical protein